MVSGTRDRAAAGRRVLILSSLVCALASCAILVSAAGVAPQQAAGATVRNVRLEQAGGGVLNIFYDLVADKPGAVFEVAVVVSQDGGQTYGLVPRSISGDVGPNVAPGTGKRIVWEAGKDVERVQVEAFRFRITPTLMGAPSARPTTPGAGVGRVSVKTDPKGATVSIDGVERGQTPVEVSDLPAGEHRVVITKAGYLENGRSVEIVAGKTQKVDVKLTAETAQAAPAQPSAAQAPKKGSPLKWILPVAGGAGAAGAVLALKGGNKTPTAGSINVTPTGVALVSATIVSFNSTGASDPSGNGLTYNWNYGDGGTGSGQSSTHTYQSAGDYNVQVNVSNGKGSATASAPLSAKSLAGTWTGWVDLETAGRMNATLTLSQSGPNVTGSYKDQYGTGTLSAQGGWQAGIVENPKVFTICILLQSGNRPYPTAGQVWLWYVIKGTFGDNGNTLTCNTAQVNRNCSFTR